MKRLPCPICDVPMPAPWQEYPEYPFCSKRCKLIDLGRWIDEGYRVEKPIGQSSMPVNESPPE